MKTRFIKMMAYLCYLLIAIIFLLEVTYRFYWIDFYRPELQALNEQEITEENDCTILAVGDSFTAHPESYVKILRDSLSECKIINAGVPGTSVNQNLLPIRKRIGNFQPEILIYQIYLGNDLLEFRHRVQSDKVGVVRKFYWWLSDRISVLGFLNYRSLSVRNKVYDDLPTFQPENRTDDFAVHKFNPRTRMHIRSEPSMLEDVISNEHERAVDIAAYVEKLKLVFSQLPKSLPIVVLVVPHSIQVNELYQTRMRDLGMQLSQSNRLMQLDYPFIRYLQKELEGEHIFVANPLSALKSADRNKSIYYENDPHLNTFGQTSLGNFLVQYLKKLK